MTRAPIRLAAAAILLALPLAANADTTAGQAAALRTDLREWVAHVFGPKAKLPEKLIEVAPEGDHFRVTIALASSPGLSIDEGGTISAAVFPPQNGASWRIADLRFASPTRLTLHPKRPSASPGAITMAMSYKDMNGKGQLDPSLGTASAVQIKLNGYQLTADGPKIVLRIGMDRLLGEIGLTPTAPGRVDFSETSATDDYSSQQKSPGKPEVDMAAKRLGARLRVSALDPNRVIPLARALAALGQTERKLRAAQHEAGGKAPNPFDTEEGRSAVRAAYLAFRGIASGADLHEAIDGVRIGAAGHIVGANSTFFDWAVSTPDGTLHAQFGMAVDGISAQEIPPEAQPYLPRHFSVTPSISGIKLADLDALIMAATAPPSEHADVDARLDALLADGITIGLDKLSFNLGPADFSATGKLTALSAQKITGAADIKATGFDQLVQDAMKTPALGQAVPALAIMRSLAQTQGQALVWAVRLDNNVVTVNGRDIDNLLRSKTGPKQESK
jgi:hypothetical protein